MNLRQSKTLWQTGISCLLLLFIGSCKKDHKEDISGLGISELKSWYSKQILDNKTSMFAGYIPNWERSYTSSKEGYTVTEIGFSNPNKVAEITGTTAAGDADKDRAATETQVKLLFFNRAGSQAVFAAYMLLRGDEKQPPTSVHYKDFGQYSGTIKYFNIDGSFQNGYVISSGKVAKTITRSALTASQLLNLKERKNVVGNGPR